MAYYKDLSPYKLEKKMEDKAFSKTDKGKIRANIRKVLLRKKVEMLSQYFGEK